VTTIEELETRIRLLEDIEAIKKLKATYLYLQDARDWQGMANLFADDGLADFGSLGRIEGKAQIAEFYRDVLPRSFSFMAHMGHNPIIEVEGDRATGKWYFELPATHAPTNRAVWIAGGYEDEYVKVNGGWKLKTCVGIPYYITPYDEGWVKTKMYE